MGIAVRQGLLGLRFCNLRDYAQDKYRSIDDEPYGGGGGMVLKPGPVFAALARMGAFEGRKKKDRRKGRRDKSEGEEDIRKGGGKPWVVLPTPKGRRLVQDDLVRLAEKEHVVFLCSRYKGVDERIRGWVDEEISLGDYVIGGGEAAVLVMLEGIVRLLEGVVGEPDSVQTDSFTSGLLSAPVYTRPEEFEGLRVPQILLGGNHEQIRRWRRKQALTFTLKRRPDLVARMYLSDEDFKLLSEVLSEQTS